jgi:hypothetical protein
MKTIDIFHFDKYTLRSDISDVFEMDFDGDFMSVDLLEYGTPEETIEVCFRDTFINQDSDCYEYNQGKVIVDLDSQQVKFCMGERRAYVDFTLSTMWVK